MLWFWQSLPISINRGPGSAESDGKMGEGKKRSQQHKSAAVQTAVSGGEYIHDGC